MINVQIPYGGETYPLELTFFEHKLLEAVAATGEKTVAAYVREHAILFYQDGNDPKAFQAEGDGPVDWEAEREEAFALKWACYDSGEAPSVVLKNAIMRQWESNPPLNEASQVLKELHSSANTLMMLQYDKQHRPVADANDTLLSEGLSGLERYVELPFRPRMFFAPDLEEPLFFFMAPGSSPDELNHYVVSPASKAGAEIEEGVLWWRRWKQSLEEGRHEDWWEEVVDSGETPLPDPHMLLEIAALEATDADDIVKQHVFTNLLQLKNYIKSSQLRPEDILDAFDNTAHMLVDTINVMNNPREVFQKIIDDMLNPVAEFVCNENFEKAYELYTMKLRRWQLDLL